jgi:hypothetical protein
VRVRLRLALLTCTALLGSTGAEACSVEGPFYLGPKNTAFVEVEVTKVERRFRWRRFPGSDIYPFIEYEASVRPVRHLFGPPLRSMPKHTWPARLYVNSECDFSTPLREGGRYVYMLNRFDNRFELEQVYTQRHGAEQAAGYAAALKERPHD